MPSDAIYDDLFTAYVAIFERYSRAVDKLLALHHQGNHTSFAATALLTRELADQVKTARAAAEAHRLGL